MLIAEVQWHVLLAMFMSQRIGLIRYKAQDAEQDMLDMVHEPKKNSRLSCQIIVSNELDGLEVTIPAKQT